MTLRRAHLAGSWYPDMPGECERQIKAFLKDETEEYSGVIGGIVPHAGWFFSGKIACRVIHAISKNKQPDIIVVFGMHMSAASSPCIMIDGSWETPFGPVEIASEFAQELSRRISFRKTLQDPFAGDNTIEVQMPFISRFFPDIPFVPVGVPPTPGAIQIGEKVAETAEKKGYDIRVIGSTDLTHYGRNYGFMPHGRGEAAYHWVKNENDRKVIKAITSLKPAKVISVAVSDQSACCPGAAAAAMAAAIRKGAVRAKKIAYATSYDKHPADSFVGYAGILFFS